MGSGFAVKCLNCGLGASGITVSAEVKKTKGFFRKKVFYVKLGCKCGNSVLVPIKKLPKEILK